MREINIPGGTAVLWDSMAELTPRRRRPLEIKQSRLGPVMVRITKAGRLLCEGDLLEDRSEQRGEDGELVFTGGDVDLSERQLELLAEANDALAWALLKSWTLDLPLPSSPAEMLDVCPGDVYDVLRITAAKINAGAVDGDGFTVDAVEDETSPTGD